MRPAPSQAASVPRLMVAVTVWWARIHLGRLWSSNVTRKKNHHVVDSGPYGIVRHPIYTGVIVASIATAAIQTRWPTAPAWPSPASRRPPSLASPFPDDGNPCRGADLV